MRRKHWMNRLAASACILLITVAAAGCTEEQLEAAEVYNRSMEAMQKLDSYSVDMKLDQTMEQAGETMETTSDIKVDAIMKPELSMKMLMNMQMMDETFTMEMYATQAGLFMKDPSSEGWMKLPQKQMEEVLAGMSAESMDPASQMELLQKYVDDLSMTESDKEYKLTLNAEGEDMKALLMEQLEKQSPDQAAMIRSDMEALKIHSIDYVFGIDKKTYYPTTIDMKMKFDMSVEGDKFATDMDVTGNYSNYNKVPEIVVPEEALQAEEVGME